MTGPTHILVRLHNRRYSNVTFKSGDGWHVALAKAKWLELGAPETFTLAYAVGDQREAILMSDTAFIPIPDPDDDGILEMFRV